ncbi:MAG: hypothetical protein PVF70_10000 [Anaerolineales bacterium]|jgi:hypothetical protein
MASERVPRGSAEVVEREGEAVGSSCLIDRRGLHEEIQQAIRGRLRKALSPGVVSREFRPPPRLPSEGKLRHLLLDRMRRSLDSAQASLDGRKRAWHAENRDFQRELLNGNGTVAEATT